MTIKNELLITPEALMKEVLEIIRIIPSKPLSPDTVFLLGVNDVLPLLESWDRLQHHLFAAKLAIVRDEFSVRFPSLSNETEEFTFGITNYESNEYMKFLIPRESDDITKLTCHLVDQVYPPRGIFRKSRIQGLVPLVGKLYTTLVRYSENIESILNPYVESFGIPNEE